MVSCVILELKNTQGQDFSAKCNRNVRPRTGAIVPVVLVLAVPVPVPVMLVPVMPVDSLVVPFVLSVVFCLAQPTAIAANIAIANRIARVFFILFPFLLLDLTF